MFGPRTARTAAGVLAGMASLLLLLLAPYAAAQGGPGRHVPGEVIVVYRAGVQTQEQASVERGLGARAERVFADRAVRLLRLPNGVSTQAAIARLENDPAVEYAQPNFVYQATAVPNDPYFLGYMWAFLNEGQSGGTVDADIDAPEAWDIATGTARTRPARSAPSATTASAASG